MYVEQYNNWVRNLTGDEKRELMSLTPAEREDRFYKNLEFGTAGMRGIVALGTNRMNKYTVMRATAGLADLICGAGEAAKKRGVTISYDSRKNSYLFARVSAQVLAARGITVHLFADMRPVPVLSFAIRRLRAFAGIMITASHNPPEYNGYKVYGADGAQMGPEDAGKVVTAMENHGYFDIAAAEFDEASDLVKMIGPEFDEVYYSEIGRLALCPQYIRRVPDFKIVYTPLHGTGRKPVCGILSRLGVKNLYIVAEQAEPDENFSTVEVPNPEQKEAFALAIKTARRVGADAIIATDPDADRMGLALKDKNGEFRILSGNQIGCLLLYHILSRKREDNLLKDNSVVIKTIVSTEAARAIADDFGVETVDVLTGFKYIGEKIREYEESDEKDFLFGFEESYGYLAGTYARDKDAVAAAMLITEMAAYYAYKGKTLFDALQEIQSRYGFFLEDTSSVSFEGKRGMEQMKRIMDKVRSGPIDKIGGLKVLLRRDFLMLTATDENGERVIEGYPKSDCIHFMLEDRCWACIRPSGTEPKIKVYSASFGHTEETAAIRLAQIKEYMTGC